MALVESLSGVRGIYGIDLTEEAAKNYAKSYLNFLRKNNISNVKIVIGTDTRPSGEKLKKAIVESLNCDIVDVGIASTPMVELAVRHFNADGGIIITASHNPPEYNGFKFLQSNGGVLSEHQMNQVIEIYKNNPEKNFSSEANKTASDLQIRENFFCKKADILDEYRNFIFNIVGNDNIEKIKNNKLKIVVDPNGGTGIFSIDIFKKIGIDVVEVNSEIGKFSRVIEPNEQSLPYLKKIINENNAGFAVGFDCDADRAEILLKDGRIVSGNEMLALSSYFFLKYSKIKNKIIVVNDATSNIVRDVAKKFNAEIIETGVGEANVVEELYNQNALLGGEGSSSGVIIPPSRCRDGTLSLLAILSFMANENKTIEELVELLPKYYTISKKISYERANTSEAFANRGNFFENIKNKILEHYKNYKITSKSDSIKILISEDSFVWLRQSKTEANLLRIIADSKDKIKSEKLIKGVESSLMD